MQRKRLILLSIAVIVLCFLAYGLGATLSKPKSKMNCGGEPSPDLIRARTEAGVNYLLRVIDRNYGGAHKYYWFKNDSFRPRLHTTYTATALYTLLKYQTQMKQRQRISEIIPPVSKFLFSMQNKVNKSKAYGAFHYSFQMDEETKDYKFVVGTNSKTIYTLLALYNLTGREKYLKSARKSANWLLTMQKDNGSMYSYRRVDDNGTWYHSTQYSILYNGEVLSALSRIYRYTGEDKYRQAASEIAANFKGHVQQQGCYVSDDYRGPNPISSSWLVMSLLDYYRATGDKEAANIVFNCSRKLLKRQIKDKSSLQFGRWQRSYSTSGNGWMIEVLSQVYTQCQREKRSNCREYKRAMLRAMDWVMARTCTGDNCGDNDFARGGIYWNNNYDYIRTDSVAHALNGYIQLLDRIEEKGPRPRR